MSHHLILGGQAATTMPTGGYIGDIELRAATYRRIRGIEPFVEGRPLLDRIRRSPQRYIDEFWDALAASARLLGDVPVLSVVLLEGDTSADPETEVGDVQVVGSEDLVRAVASAIPGRYCLVGPYIFGFPQVEVALVQPMPVDGADAAIGFCQALAVHAGSLSEAHALLADYAADNGGYIRGYGPVEVTHALWLRDDRYRSDTAIAWCSGKVYFGTR